MNLTTHPKLARSKAVVKAGLRHVVFFACIGLGSTNVVCSPGWRGDDNGKGACPHRKCGFLGVPGTFHYTCESLDGSCWLRTKRRGWLKPRVLTFSRAGCEPGLERVGSW